MLTATCARDCTGADNRPTLSSKEQIKRAIRMILTFLAFAGRSRVLSWYGPSPIGAALLLLNPCQGQKSLAFIVRYLETIVYRNILDVEALKAGFYRSRFY